MKAIITAMLIAFSFPAFAHGPQKGPNGGPMEDVAGVHVELVRSGSGLTVYVSDEGGKPVATDGFTASALVVSGTQREIVKLVPHAPNHLKGETKSMPTTGSDFTVMLKTSAGKSGQAKFKL